ncbi:hypothetical protein ACFL3V_04610 [Nanoarchaeota archaeon]
MGLVDKVSEIIQHNVSLLKREFSDTVKRYQDEGISLSDGNCAMRSSVRYSPSSSRIYDFKNYSRSEPEFDEISLVLGQNGKISIDTTSVARYKVIPRNDRLTCKERPGFSYSLADMVLEESVFEYNRQLRGR